MWSNVAGKSEETKIKIKVFSYFCFPLSLSRYYNAYPAVELPFLMKHIKLQINRQLYTLNCLKFSDSNTALAVSHEMFFAFIDVNTKIKKT